MRSVHILTCCCGDNLATCCSVWSVADARTFQNLMNAQSVFGPKVRSGSWLKHHEKCPACLRDRTGPYGTSANLPDPSVWTESGLVGPMQTFLTRQRGQNRALWDLCVISCFLPKVTTLLTDTSPRLLHLQMKNFPSQRLF